MKRKIRRKKIEHQDEKRLRKFLILREAEEVAVKLQNDRHGLHLSVTRNKWQWSSIDVSDGALDMILEVLLQYKKEHADGKKDKT